MGFLNMIGLGQATGSQQAAQPSFGPTKHHIVVNDASKIPSIMNGLNQSVAAFPGTRGNESTLPMHLIDSVAHGHGATVLPRSTTGEELYRFHYQQRIHDRDLWHLKTRDPITRAVVRFIPKLTWVKPPMTGSPRLDEFLTNMRNKGLNQALIRADMHQRLPDGLSFVYIRTPGRNDDQPLLPGDRQWTRFDVIRGASINWSKTEMDVQGDPILSGPFDHGIEKLVYNTATGDEREVHGHRLILVTEDEDRTPISPQIRDNGSKFNNAQPQPVIIHSIFDHIWNIRRIHFSGTEAFKVPPLVLELDVANGFKKLKEDEAEDIEIEAQLVQSGDRDIIGPNRGIKVYRMDPAQMPDPEWTLRLAVGAIVSETELTHGSLVPFSRGSEQVTEGDRNDLQTNIDNRREAWCHPIYEQVLNRARWVGLLPKTIEQWPLNVDWPRISTMDLKTEALMLKNYINTAFQAGLSKRAVPRKIDELFPIDEEAPRPRTPEKDNPAPNRE